MIWRRSWRIKPRAFLPGALMATSAIPAPTDPMAPAMIPGMKAGGAGQDGIMAMAARVEATMKDFMMIEKIWISKKIGSLW